jgi:hypothetical protein
MPHLFQSTHGCAVDIVSKMLGYQLEQHTYIDLSPLSEMTGNNFFDIIRDVDTTNVKRSILASRS